MTGALIQLVAKGIQDIFVINDPQITYFKIVYRRHTNFSMEAIPQYFNYKPTFGKKATCTLALGGDLVANTHLVVTLPKIKPFILDDGTVDPYSKFAWVKKIGYALINKIELEIGGQLIDRHYGEWLNILSEIFDKKEDRGIDKLIGNIEELTSFTSTKDTYTMYIPLQFWFCKNSSLALPILCLHHSEVKINIELNPLENCCLVAPTNYIVLEDDLVSFQKYDYIEQTVGNSVASGIFIDFDSITKRLYYSRITRNKFISLPISQTNNYNINNILTNSTYKQYLIKSRTSANFCLPKIGTVSYSYNQPALNNIILQECHLLVNYIYLDSDERNKFIQNKHEYLIDQLQIFSPQTITTSNAIVRVDTANPSKFIVWVAQLLYFLDTNNNDMFNYTDDYLYIKNNLNKKNILAGSSLVDQECIILNGGFDRLSNRSHKYFNYIQAHQYLPTSPAEGINFYSFCLLPQEFQPSGSCNMSYVGYTEISLKLSHLINNNNPALFRGYSLAQNIFRIIDGLGGLVFIK